MNNNHIMITRSKKIDISNNPNNDIEDEEIEEIDEFGNIKGFIDYSYDEDFDKNILKQELNKFKKRKIYTNYNKNKKIKFKNKEDNINKKKKNRRNFFKLYNCISK